MTHRRRRRMLYDDAEAPSSKFTTWINSTWFNGYSNDYDASNSTYNVSGQNGTGYMDRPVFGFEGHAWAGIVVATLAAAGVVMTTLLLVAFIKRANDRRFRRRNSSVDDSHGNLPPYIMASAPSDEIERRPSGYMYGNDDSLSPESLAKTPVICMHPDGETMDIALEENVPDKSMEDVSGDIENIRTS